MEGQAADAGEPGPDADRGVTPGGYSYEVVRDDAPPAERSEKPRREPRGEPRRFSSGVLLAAVALTAVVAVVGGWFAAALAGDGGADDSRTNANVGSVINAFSRQEGAVATRFEGALPPGYPEDIPVYPGAQLVSSVQQVSGDDVSYLVAYDSADPRHDVAAFYGGAFDEDPWQIDAAQDGVEASVHQFSRIDDPDVQGFVLSAESKHDRITTILLSLQVISGAPEEEDREPYEPGVSKSLPEGFPTDEVPIYEGATVIESVFQREPGSESYSVTVVTQDDGDDVLDFYRSAFEDAGWAVEDAGDGGSALEDAQALQFTSADGATQGLVTAGVFPEDDGYTVVEVQLRQSS